MKEAEPKVITDTDLAEGWATELLLHLCRLVRGVSYKKGEASAMPSDGLVPLVRANNIDGDLHFNDLQYVPETRIGKEQLLSVGDVVVAMSSGSKKVVAKAACLRSEWQGAFGAFCGVLRPSPQLEVGFFGYYFQAREYRDYISAVSAGTNINNLKREYFANIDFPVPPLAEQKRIVAMVEKLLARVNAARERLANVPAILKRFRQSVLAAACSGRLTADWRDAHPDIEPASQTLRFVCEDRGLTPEHALAPTRGDDRRPDGWATTTLGFLAEPTLKGRPYVTSGSRGWAKYVSGRGPFFVRSENINTEYLRLGTAVHVDPPPGAEADRTRVQPNDLLLTITGNNVGRTAVVPADCPAAHVSQHVAIIRTSPRCHVPYLWLWVRSEEHGQAQLRSHFYGETKPGLNLEQVRNVWVYFPPIEEQHEIVRRVEALFNLADTIEQRVTAGTQRADKLTQAILAKAFRGELVPTEAELARREGRSYEPACVLLERIKAEREAAAAKPKPKRAAKPKRIPFRTRRKQPKGINFKRGAIASYIVARLHERPTFGRTQLEKLFYLTQSHLGIDLAMEFKRKAAGPYDEEVIKVESLARKQEWFTTHRRERFGYRYEAGRNIADRVGGAATLLGDERAEMNRMLDFFARMNTEQAELLGTVHAAWNDLLLDGREPTDDEIIREVRENWHEAKQRFTPDRVQRCIDWIRRERFVPRGKGPCTIRIRPAEGPTESPQDRGGARGKVGRERPDLTREAGASEADADDRRDRRSITDYTTAEVMAAFRQACRGRGDMEREELLRDVARRLGFQRLGRTVRQTLKGHLRAAIRRRIIGADGDTVWPETRRMDEYTRDELVDTIRSVMRRGGTYDREEVIAAVARHLGFTRVRDTIAAPIRSAINAAIRRDAVGYEGSIIWREH